MPKESKRVKKKTNRQKKTPIFEFRTEKIVMLCILLQKYTLTKSKHNNLKNC